MVLDSHIKGKNTKERSFLFHYSMTIDKNCLRIERAEEEMSERHTNFISDSDQYNLLVKIPFLYAPWSPPFKFNGYLNTFYKWLPLLSGVI